MNKYIEALLAERAGYERRGLKDRVKAVDAALREVGFDHKYMPEVEVASVEPVLETAVLKSGKKKKA
jgi:uncharacterized protein (UPF0335 family)